jgi:hypothetical protein
MFPDEKKNWVNVKNNKKTELKRCSKSEFLLQIFGVQIVEDLSFTQT